MSTDANQELNQFHQFITEKLAANSPLPSPEEALDQWRSTHSASEEDDVDEFNDYDETVAAIQETLDDPRPDVPWEVFKQELRDQHERLKRT